MADRRNDLFGSSREEAQHFKPHREKVLAQDDAAYQLAFADMDFLLREELRPVRLQLELLRPELLQRDAGIDATVVFFGSARIPSPEKAAADLEWITAQLNEKKDDPVALKKLKIAKSMAEKSVYYDEARKLACLVSTEGELPGLPKLYVSTGGGPGIMEGANRGAHEADKKSLGLAIVIPEEQTPNPYVTPDLTFPFHYFAIRKMHFLIRAKALIAFPGGFGTLDELFDALTLLQTRKMQKLPLILFSRKYWEGIINFQSLVDEGTIDEEDINLFHYVETAEEAWAYIKAYYEAV